MARIDVTLTDDQLRDGINRARGTLWEARIRHNPSGENVAQRRMDELLDELSRRLHEARVLT